MWVCLYVCLCVCMWGLCLYPYFAFSSLFCVSSSKNSVQASEVSEFLFCWVLRPPPPPRLPPPPTPAFFRRIISVRWYPWLNIFLLPGPSTPLCWPGWERHICSFPSCVESWRCRQPSAWGLEPTSSPSLGRRTQNSPGRGEPVSADRQLPQGSLAAASAANSFCNLHNRPEDGALDPGVKSQRLWLFLHLNWSQIRLVELLVVILSLLLLLCALTTRAHSHESTMSWLFREWQMEGTSFFWSPSLAPPELPCCQSA